MAGILLGVQPGLFEPLFHHIVDGICRHAGMPPGNKKGVPVGSCCGRTNCQPICDCLLTGGVQKNDTLLVSLAQDPELLTVNGPLRLRPTNSDIRTPQFKKRTKIQ